MRLHRPHKVENGYSVVTIEGAGEHFSFGAGAPAAIVDHVLPLLHDLVRELRGGGAHGSGHCARPVPRRRLRAGAGVRPGASVSTTRNSACRRCWALPPRRACRTGSARRARRPARSRAARPGAEGARAIELTAPPDELVRRSITGSTTTWRCGRRRRCAARLPPASPSAATSRRPPELERFYLETLMRNHDAVEGIQGVPREPAKWSDA